MVFLLAALLLLESLLLPLTLRLEARHQERTALRAQLQYAFLRSTWPSRRKTTSGKRLHRGSRLFSALRSSAQARRFFLRHIRLERLDALILLHTGDAAQTSLTTGVLIGLACIPAAVRNNVHIRILPDYFSPHTTLQARCIVRLRLGTLLLTMLMLLGLRLQQKVRTSHGTSHW